MTESLRIMLRHRLVVIAASAALALTTCSGTTSRTAQQAGVSRTATDVVTAAPVPVTTPPPIPSLAAAPEVDAPAAPEVPLASDEPVEDAAPQAVEPSAEPPAPLPEEVPLVTPSVIVHGGDAPLSDAALEEVAGDEALTTAAVTAFDLEAVGPSGETAELRAMTAGPADVRPFTPDVTAQNVGVWERITDGDVVVRHDVAQELGLELGGTITLRTVHAAVPARVGAFAANGAPPLADLLVPHDLGELLGADAVNTLIVGADGDAQTLADHLGEQFGARAEVVRPPAPRQAGPKRSGSVTLEPFSYTSRGDGTIAIDPAWVAKNIVTVEIPGMGTTRCHRVMVPQLQAALREIAEAGLYDHFDRSQFAGCFVPRHILWNPQRGLSMHAWGLAIDFNARDNAYGATPRMDLRIVEIFEKWGFAWGGWWSTPDGMHFELARVVEVG
ncbi:M15 family metallopeptidase [Egicoccus sp. AB-alg6-2]|uniref:M15 family metallopeptidase n=1 Tax=Egicoccus sp. AB-alg6-2 TaxID=3242692 RepID=UPI00359E6114